MTINDDINCICFSQEAKLFGIFLFSSTGCAPLKNFLSFQDITSLTKDNYVAIKVGQSKVRKSNIDFPKSKFSQNNYNNAQNKDLY